MAPEKMTHRDRGYDVLKHKQKQDLGVGKNITSCDLIPVGFRTGGRSLEPFRSVEPQLG